MTRSAIALSLAIILALGAMTAGPARAAGSCGVLPGLWAWFTNGDVTFRGNGTLVQGRLTGRWQCANGRVTIDWSHGYRDTLTVAQDGRSMIRGAAAGAEGSRKRSPAMNSSETSCPPITP